MASKERNYIRFSPCGCGPDIVGAPCQSLLCAELNEDNEIIIRSEDSVIPSKYTNYPRVRISPEGYGDQIGNYAPCVFKVVIAGFTNKSISESKYTNCDNLNGEYYCYKINNLYSYSSNTGSTGGGDDIAHGHTSRWLGHLCKKENYKINSICGLGYILITLYASKTLNSNSKYDIFIKCSIVDSNNSQFYSRIKIIGELSTNINFSGFGTPPSPAHANFSNLNCFNIEDLLVDDLPTTENENACCEGSSISYSVTAINNMDNYFNSYSKSRNFIIRDYDEIYDNYVSYAGGGFYFSGYDGIGYGDGSPYYLYHGNVNFSNFFYLENSGDYENISASTSNNFLSNFGRSISIAEQPRFIQVNISGIQNSECLNCDSYNGKHILMNVGDTRANSLIGGAPTNDYYKAFTIVDVELPEDLDLASHNSTCGLHCSTYIRSMSFYEKTGYEDIYVLEFGYSFVNEGFKAEFEYNSGILTPFNLIEPEIDIVDTTNYCDYSNVEVTISDYLPNEESDKNIPCINPETPCYFCYEDEPPESILVSIPDNWVAQAINTSCSQKLRDCLGNETFQNILKFYCGDYGKYPGSMPTGDFVLNRGYLISGNCENNRLPNGLNIHYLAEENTEVKSKIAFIGDETWRNSCLWLFINNENKKACGYHPIVNWDKEYGCADTYEVINTSNPINLSGPCSWDYMYFRIYPKIVQSTNFCNGLNTYLDAGNYFVFELNIANIHTGGYLNNPVYNSLDKTIDGEWDCNTNCICCSNPDCSCNGVAYIIPSKTSVFRKFIKFIQNEDGTYTFPNGNDDILYGNETGLYVDCKNLNIELSNIIANRSGSNCGYSAENFTGWVWGGDSVNQYTTSDKLDEESNDGCGQYKVAILEPGASYSDKSNSVTINVSAL